MASNCLKRVHLCSSEALQEY